MKSEVFLLTKNTRITKGLKRLSNATLHTIAVPSQMNKVFKKNGKHLEVALLDLTYSEEDLNKFIFYVKKYRKDIPVLLLGAKHALNIQSEAMRNLDVYGYIKYPDKVEEVEKILEGLNKSFQLDMDRKFDKVDYLEGEKVFACTFKDMKKYFLKRENIPDSLDSKIKSIRVDETGHHFTIEYSSGERSVIPWDFVKSICDEKYEYYKGAAGSNITAQAIGQKIKMQRQFVKLTQEELAIKTGIQRPNIARIEAGRHASSLETLEKIARALNKPVAYFLTR